MSKAKGSGDTAKGSVPASLGKVQGGYQGPRGSLGTPPAGSGGGSSGGGSGGSSKK